MLLLMGPGSSHQIDLTLRRIGLEDVIARSVQVCIVGSTLLATVLFGALLWKRNRGEYGDSLPRVRFEGILLLAWWVTLLGFLAYGFMRGMGG
jgi:hypothetical protein